jgi:hypothetical protein
LILLCQPSPQGAAQRKTWYLADDHIHLCLAEEGAVCASTYHTKSKTRWW